MAFTSRPLPLPLHETGVPFARVDLEFQDLDHSGESYEGRIFFNRPDATVRTPLEEAEGYAGSLFVFGHPHCWGDAGHCAVPPGPLHGYDSRPAHHLVPQRHVVEVTEAVRRLIEGPNRTVTVTVLPVVRRGGRHRLDTAQLKFGELALVTYD